MKIFTAFAGFLLTGLVMAAPVTKIVAFGDSLSDNGNLYEYMKHQLPVSPPYYEGRFANGPIWLERLSEFYYPGDAKAHLQDFAFGGAGVLAEGEISDASIFTLQSEIDSYLLANQDKADADSMYTVWIGSNNYLAIPDDADAAVARVISGLTSSLRKLASKGAKHILVVNLPDLGRTPVAREFDATSFLTMCSTKHNAALAMEVETLKNQYPEVQWIYLDVDNMMDDMFTSPEKYGFTNIEDTCYESAIDDSSANNVLQMVANIQPKKSTDACTGYLFFDLVHPTATAHHFMAEKAKQIFAEAGVEFK